MKVSFPNFGAWYATLPKPIRSILRTILVVVTFPLWLPLLLILGAFFSVLVTIIDVFHDEYNNFD